MRDKVQIINNVADMIESLDKLSEDMTQVLVSVSELQDCKKAIDNLIGVYKDYLVQFADMEDVVFWIQAFINDLTAMRNGETFEEVIPCD